MNESRVSPGAIILLAGPTGSGKGTQGALLNERLGWHFISAGQMIRDSDDPELKAIHDQGKLVPPAKIIELIFKAINSRPDDEVIILDGFPRNMAQLEAFKGEMTDHHRHVGAIIHLTINPDESAKRLKSRGRQDDSEEALRNKLQHYTEEVRPVVEYYQKEGSLVDIDGMQPIEDVYRAIIAALGIAA